MRCGSCGSRDRVQKLDRSPALRCWDCRNTVRSWCYWPKDSDPVTVEPPRPQILRSPDFVTAGQLLERQQHRVQAIQRYQRRRTA